MQNKSNIDFFDKSDDEIDLKELIKVIVSGKWTIFLITTCVSIFAVIYSLSLPNIYESKALLVSSSSDNKTSIAQNYGNLANIAGIDLNSAGSENNAVTALEKLNTLSFFESNILPNIFLPDLMAYKEWDSAKNNSKYNNEIYNVELNSWVRDFSYPQSLIPSAQESFSKFKKDHLSISIDKKTNFITLKIKHQSPYISQEWNKLLVNQINNFYRKKDKNEAEKAVFYLNNTIAKTNLSEIKQSIAILLQQEIQKLTLIEANQFYVYEYIDPPVVMEKKSGPNRSYIVILATLLGLILSAFYVLLRNNFNFKK